LAKLDSVDGLDVPAAAYADGDGATLYPVVGRLMIETTEIGPIQYQC
jgi:hypothetical protein